MKKKIALLLAIAMVVTMLPATVFGATSNSVDRLSNVPKDTVLWEQGVLGGPVGLQGARIDGTDLVLRVSNWVLVDGTIPINLSNAKWSFANGKTDTTRTASAAAVGLDYFTVLPHDPVTNPNVNYNVNNGIFTNEWIPTTSVSYDAHVSTYFRYGMVQSKAQDASWGSRNLIEVPYRLDITGDSTAVLTITSGTSAGWAAIGYGPVGGTTYQSVSNGVLYEIRIPMVIVTTANDANAVVSVGENIAGVSKQDLIVVGATAGGVTARGGDVVVARNTFTINPITFTESMLGAASPTGDPLTGGGSVILTLPAGFHWFDTDWYNKTDGSGVYNVKVILMPGLTWLDNYLPNSAVNSGAGWGNSGATNESVRYDKATGDDLISFANVVPRFVRNGEPDDTMLKISFFNFRKSSQNIGSITVQGLSFYCDDNVPFGTTAKLFVNEDASGSELNPAYTVTGEYAHTLGVAHTNFAVATRQDWTVKLSTPSTPTLITGRWIGDSAVSLDDVADDIHATDKITFEEVTPSAWWGNRYTVFMLPASNGMASPGVKIRKLQLIKDDSANFTNDTKAALFDTDSSSNTFKGATIPGGVYVNDGQFHGLVMVKDNTFTLQNIGIVAGQKAKLVFKMWLSVEYGYGLKFGGDSGIADISLSVPSMATSDMYATTSGVPSQLGEVPSVVVAKAQDPIKVEVAKVTELQIGLQSQATADIKITENGTGYLLRGKQVIISISDLISNDMVFTNNASIKVSNDSNMLLGNITRTGGISGFAGWVNYANGTGGYGGNLNIGTTATDQGMSFTIDRPSTNKAAEITISNIGVKLNRAVPLTNAQLYKAIIWGSAVAENFGYMSTETVTYNVGTKNDPIYKDFIHPFTSKFTTPGAIVDYAKVVSQVGDLGMNANRVTVTEGESYYTVNGTTYNMGLEGEKVAAYISTASNSMMVPTRFIANALGISNDNIYWDNVNKTVTIVTSARTVQFTANSSIMRVNGAEVQMLSKDATPLPVKAELTRDRMYVPFRALGEAFGIEVGWDDATRTATYNPSAVG